jgi:methylenetetrahydrofolate reductase (NADPH)
VIKDHFSTTEHSRPIPLSFEYFPPKTEAGWEKLFETMQTLRPLQPSHVSVTYGAGGSTRENTHKLVKKIRQELDQEVVAHLTCVGSSRQDIRRILQEYEDIGVREILALKGDIPLEGEMKGDFHHALDLVRFIRQEKPDFGIGAACFPEGHPDTPNRLLEMDYLKAKVDAGVDYLVTQLFFDNRDYFDFVERCRISGITVPIIPGLMPLTSAKALHRTAEIAAGSRFPAELLEAVNAAQGDAEVAGIGRSWTINQIQGLLEAHVPGIHLYTLNASQTMIKILDALPHWKKTSSSS